MQYPDKAYIYPFINNVNRYNYLQQDAISECGYTLASLEITANNSPCSFFKSNSNNICVLNWLESGVVNPDGSISIKGTLHFFQYLSLLILSRTKIYWVRHNYAPHEARGISYIWAKAAIKLLEWSSTKTISHSKSRGSNSDTYIPHPLYKETPPSSAAFNSRLVFIFLGRGLRYKGLDNLLQIWPPSYPLKIYGSLEDKTYGSRLKSIASERNLNVDFRFEFIPTDDIDDILIRSDVVILPHKIETALVSGSYYLAKTYGMPLLIHKNSFALNTDDKTVYEYSNEEDLIENIQCLESIAHALNRIDIFREAESHNGIARVKALWKRTLTEQ